VSLSTSPHRATTVKRETIQTLAARDAAGRDVVLPRGAMVRGFRIVRCTDESAEPYAAHFEWEEREYFCPLNTFLPRTQITGQPVC
jgi:hypothetical protein